MFFFLILNMKPFYLLILIRSLEVHKKTECIVDTDTAKHAWTCEFFRSFFSVHSVKITWIRSNGSSRETLMVCHQCGWHTCSILHLTNHQSSPLHYRHYRTQDSKLKSSVHTMRSHTKVLHSNLREYQSETKTRWNQKKHTGVNKSLHKRSVLKLPTFILEWDFVNNRFETSYTGSNSCFIKIKNMPCSVTIKEKVIIHFPYIYHFQKLSKIKITMKNQ